MLEAPDVHDPTPRADPRHLTTAVRVLVVLLVAQTLAIVVADLPGVRTVPGFIVPLDGWLQGSCFVTAAVLCLARVARRDEDAVVWTWIGLALATRAFAFVWFFAVVRWLEPQPYPSVSDAAWLTTVVLMMVGLVTLVRGRFAHLGPGLALDGVTAVLASAAVAVALLFDTLVARVDVPGATAVVVTNLAYPLLDIMLVLVLVGVLVGYAWRPPVTVWALALGLLGFVVTDTIFLAQVTAGTFRPGTLLSSFTVVTNTVIALAAWLPQPVDRRPPRHEQLPGVVLPAVFVLSCLGVLVVATVHPVPILSVLLASLGVVAAIVRTALAFRTLRSVAEHRKEARTDELTGLANRRAFNEALAEALADRSHDRPLSLLIVDLDDFKVVNDTLGHHNGDELLRGVASRLLDGLRDTDLLTRIGGDEFAVVLDGAGAARASQVAERLRAGLRRPFRIASRHLDVAASIGIAVFPEDGEEPADLLQHADLAMYEAKVARTGQSVYRPEPHQANRERLQSVDRLREAIEMGEIELHYQPLVALRTGATVGVEALARWRHPEAGLVPPASFLPMVESGGLMAALTRSVLDQALRQGAAWREQGHDLTVAVNMSVTNLLDSGFPDEVAERLERTGFPGRLLELELTEDLFMADPERAREVIRVLQELDVRLVVDDYGTGYSSLGYLRDLHEISGLKLDRSFVTPLAEDERAAAIVESTIAMATSLELSVVAEGVETAVVRDRLVELGCTLAQGYHFARPAPADRLDLSRHRRQRGGC